MGSSTEKLVRMMVAAVLAAAVVTPAAAQFGGLKKKVRAAAGAGESKEKPAPPAPAEGDAGTLVLDDDAVNRYLLYLTTAQAEREAAKKEDTPYGRYLRAEAAADAAAAKCSAAQAQFPQRMGADEKLRLRYTAMSEKMMAAMEKQNMKLYEAYADSSLAIMDPSCAVKKPARPDDWNEMQRQVDERAEKKGAEAAGLDGRELGQIAERAFGILKDAPAHDTSPSEIAAVKKREAELKRALGMEEVPVARAQQAAPAAAAESAPPPPPGAQVTAEQRALSECTSKNAEKNDQEVKRLGERAAAAAEANNTAAALAYADSIQRIMQQGCTGH